MPQLLIYETEDGIRLAPIEPDEDLAEQLEDHGLMFSGMLGVIPAQSGGMSTFGDGEFVILDCTVVRH